LTSVSDNEVTVTNARKSKSGTNKACKTSTAAPQKRTKKKVPSSFPTDNTESSILPPPVQEDPPLLPNVKTPTVVTCKCAEDISGVVDGTASGKHNAGGGSVHGVKKLLLWATVHKRRPRLQNALVCQFIAVIGMYM
jgi:hypothetical protein